MFIGRPYIGQILVKKRLITEDDLQAALRQKAQSPEFIGKILVDMQLITEDELYAVLAEQMDVPFVSLSQVEIEPNVLKTISSELVFRLGIIPVRWEGHKLCIAVSDPNQQSMITELQSVLKCSVCFLLASPDDITAAINTYYGPGGVSISAGKDILDNFRPVIEDVRNLSENNEASIVHLVNHIMISGYQSRATDIHLEPYEDEFRIRYRIDGILYSLPAMREAKEFQGLITSRIKLTAGMDIAERRVPQDGRMTVKIGNDNLNLRVSVLPTPFGESIQVRLFSTKIFTLDDLGLGDADRGVIENILSRPHGIILVTGPTGSGKTTTLYACLHRLNSSRLKIITIEDPVEYHIKGITQVQTHAAIGLTFDRALRSMLRHDPDVMLVGEIRDRETANIATNMALTGHLVLSTIHSNDAAGVFSRFLDMQVEPHLIVSSVECVISQSLVRVLCPNCKEPREVPEGILREMGAAAEAPVTVFGPKGCPQCQFTGYYGRTMIYEVIRMDDEVRQLVLNRAPTHEIQKFLLSKGFISLRQNGLEKVKAGITSVEEVLEAAYQWE
jgi:type II secretory ATPase GspE/PulE/Tfp pilus assembly ATPase PilB-like protein